MSRQDLFGSPLGPMPYDWEMQCTRANCVVHEVAPSSKRVGHLQCACGESWSVNLREWKSMVQECDQAGDEVTATSCAKHRDALIYQEAFRLAGKPVPAVDLDTMQPAPAKKAKR